MDARQITDKDYKEIPPLTDDFFAEGQMYKDGFAVKRRGRGKQKKPVKVMKSLRLDPEILEFFQEDVGNGYLTEINNVLIAHVKREKRKRKRS